MLFECEFCGEEGMELKLDQALNPFTGGTYGMVSMKCIHCGAHEPCESDDLIGFIMQIVGEKDYQAAMVKALKILWEHEHMKEVTE